MSPKTSNRHRPLSLPPTSPFNPFSHSPYSPISPFLDSAGSRSSASSFEPNVKTAYVAERSFADLISVFDMTPVKLRIADETATGTVESGPSTSLSVPTIIRSTTMANQPLKVFAAPLIPTQRISSPPLSAVGNPQSDPTDDMLIHPLPPQSPPPTGPLPPTPEHRPFRMPGNINERPYAHISRRASVSSTVSSCPSSASALHRIRNPPPGPGESWFRWSIGSGDAIYDPLPGTSDFLAELRKRDEIDVDNSNDNDNEETLDAADGDVPQSTASSMLEPSPSRTSGGTFGERRRSSAGGSSSSGLVSSIGRGPFADVQDPDFRVGPNGRRRSSSASSGSASTRSSGSRVHSTHSQRTRHRRAESDRAITTHLLEQAAKNDRRIVPRARPSPLGQPFDFAQPPSWGTPLRGGGVKEESIHGESGLIETDQTLKERVRASKLIQLLGDGAEEARARLEFEKKAYADVIEQKPTVTGEAVHRTANSHNRSLSLSTEDNNLPGRTRTQIGSTQLEFQSGYGYHDNTAGSHHHPHASIDSIPSIHPSIAESFSTVSRLLPAPPISVSPAIPPKGRPSSRPIPADLSVRLELDPEQRIRLLKRAKKLEQVLGQPLNEMELEKHVIEPHTGVHTTNIRYHENVLSDSPSPRRSAIPEWLRDDCVPKSIRATSPPILSRSGSDFARKAKAAFGMDKASESDGDLKVYVSRQMSVAETSSPATRPRFNRGSTEPVTPINPPSPEDDRPKPERDDDDKVVKRSRRQQVVKLQRLLGVPVPVALLDPSSQEDVTIASTSTKTVWGDPDSPSGQSFLDMGDSPRKGYDGSSWANKLRQTINNRDRKQKLSSVDGNAIMTGGRSSPPVSHSYTKGPGSSERLGRTVSPKQSKMTDGERYAARKKAAKLEQMFGDAPPQKLYLSPKASPKSKRSGRPLGEVSPNHGPSRSTTPQREPGPYDLHNHSLRNLLYLMENDQEQLGDIVDSLDESRPQSHHVNLRDSPSPPSPMVDTPHPRGREREPQVDEHGLPLDPDLTSHAARRRRTGKLTQFFGETGIDFSHPPERKDMDKHGRRPRPRSRSRRDTLEEVLGEMLSGIRDEGSKGRMKIDEVDRLGHLMKTLKVKKDRLGWEQV